MLRAKLLFATLFTFVLFSCDRNGVYEENINTPKNSWNMNEVARFDVPVKDTLSFFNIFINIRNTTDYPNCNLYLFVSTTSPAGAVVVDTIEGYLADDQGKWLGRGFGYIRDNRFLYKHNVRFPQMGNYKIEVKQAMRTEDLEGIKSVGVRVEKSRLGGNSNSRQPNLPFGNSR